MKPKPNRLSPSRGVVPLSVDGPRIVDPAGAPVLLRGVNRSGLEYSLEAASAGITCDHLAHLTRDWGANIIRLPFNQTWALREDYLAEIDRVIAWAAENGAYTLLDLQWLDAEREFGAP
ncbi:MAG: cellulase family glycosylhydrolase, partial [Acidobacteriota bacterium]